jgi:probable HAF family extracellular repeat protein
MFQPAFVTGADGKNMRYAVGVGSVDSNEARDINDAGQIIGVSVSADGSSRGFISSPPDYYPPADLGTLDTTGEFASSFAYGINAEGRVVGTWEIAEGISHAFITGANGASMVDLGTLGGERSAGYGINSTGQVVGFSQADDGSSRAFITGPDGFGMTDLNSLVDLPQGVVLDEARAVNELGQVIANANNGHAYLLSPIPEPEIYALMLAGLGVVGFMARRRKTA